MNIDWSKAPKDATHFSPPFEGYVGLWARTDGKTWMYKSLNGSGNWYVGPHPKAKEEYLPRPAPWTGEGLPPVGTVCEWLMDQTWKRVEIRYVSKHTILAAILGGDDEDPEFALDPDGQEFRPIRTAEQIAAEERRVEIKHIQAASVVNCGPYITESSAAAIYDAGYRKVAS